MMRRSHRSHLVLTLLVACLTTATRSAVLNCSDVSPAEYQAAVSNTLYATWRTPDCWSANALGKICQAWPDMAKQLCPATCRLCQRVIDFGLPDASLPPWSSYDQNATGLDKWGQDSLITHIMSICNEVPNLTCNIYEMSYTPGALFPGFDSYQSVDTTANMAVYPTSPQLLDQANGQLSPIVWSTPVTSTPLRSHHIGPQLSPQRTASPHHHHAITWYTYM